MKLPAPGEFRNIVVLTGAGLSTGSGLPTYRGKNGLWKDGVVDPRATAEGIESDLLGVWEFFLPMKEELLKVEPNAGHLALAAFERSLPQGSNFLLVTQNVDGLHRRAGSRNVVELHGSLLRSRCTQELCGEPSDDLRLYPGICTRCGARLRPDIVLFGEAVTAVPVVRKALSSADLFLAVGTSGTVMPAAMMVDYAKELGAVTVEFNLEPSGRFDHFVEGPAESTLGDWLSPIE